MTLRLALILTLTYYFGFKKPGNVLHNFQHVFSRASAKAERDLSNL